MTKTVAIMQPYVFPYLGYFCLTEASDIFVFYDDVNFIPRGWINRNRVLINGSPHTFTIPVSGASQNVLICDIETHHYSNFRTMFLKQIRLAYSKAPYFDPGFDYVAEVLNPVFLSISDIAVFSIEMFYRYIGCTKEFIRSSEAFRGTRGINRADRLITITKALHSSEYVNAAGGSSLYNKTYFSERGVNLSFIKPHLRKYKQIGSNDFHAGLSIIDVVMNNDVDTISEMINDYELLQDC